MADLPHFRMPFGLDEDGHVAEVEQDSIEDVAGCVEVVLRTPRGWRDDNPEFGTPDPTFSSPPDSEDVRAAVSESEPRAEVTVEDDMDAFDVGLLRVQMHVGAGGQ